jgi:hypothetical protein
MSNVHKKKRNAGLLYEFLVQTISQALIEGDEHRSKVALNIMKRHFKPGTELYKELKLINALFNTTVTSDTLATSIMSEVRQAVGRLDAGVLDKEKSRLIHSVNHGLKDRNFYDRQVVEYRMLATIQMLLNEWRSGEPNIERMARYEDQVLQWLMSEKKKPDTTVISEESAGTSRLLMKVMMQKLHEKYSEVLNPKQKMLLRAYAFSTAKEDPEIMRHKLEETRESLVSLIDLFRETNPENEFINNKMDEVKKQLLTESLTEVDDDVVTRFMLYTKLLTELESEEGK